MSLPRVSSTFSSFYPITSQSVSFPCDIYILLLLLTSTQTVAHDHFGPSDIDFLDLFLPIKISSVSRARAFLWLAFHYHEAPFANPFEDEHARQNVGLIPGLVVLSEEEFEQENVDPEDERDYATKMTKLRMEFLAKNAQSTEGNNPKDRKGITKSKARASSPGKSVPTKRERSDPDSSVEEGNAEEIDHLGTAPHAVFSLVLLISCLGRPSQKRRPNAPKPIEISHALSESSTPRTFIGHPNGSHRSILQRIVFC